MTALGYLGGMTFLLLSCFIAHKSLFIDYWTHQLPRIAKYDDLKVKWKFPYTYEGISQHLARSHVYSPYTLKEGKQYDTTCRPNIRFANLTFVLGTTPLAGNFYRFLAKFKLAEQGAALLSFMIYLIFFLNLWIWQQWRLKKSNRFTLYEEFIYWQMVFIVVLLAGLRTWSENTVWLLPFIFILICEYPPGNLRMNWHCFFWLLSLLGFYLILMSDHYFLKWFYQGNFILSSKYCLAELLIFLSLQGFLTQLISSSKIQS